MKAARLALDLSVKFISTQTGLSISEYDDIELRGDGFFSDISMGSARRISRMLQLDLIHLSHSFYSKEISDDIEPYGVYDFYSRHIDVAISLPGYRESPTHFETATGWGFDILPFVTRTPDFLETLPIEAVVKIGGELKIPAARLIGRQPSGW